MFQANEPTRASGDEPERVERAGDPARLGGDLGDRRARSIPVDGLGRDRAGRVVLLAPAQDRFDGQRRVLHQSQHGPMVAHGEPVAARATGPSHQLRVML